MKFSVQRNAIGIIGVLSAAFVPAPDPVRLIVGVAAMMVMFGAKGGNSGEVSGGEGVVVRIGKFIVALAITAIIGVGFFCGGLIFGFGFMSRGAGGVYAFLIWGVGIIIWFFTMKGIFYKKKTISAVSPIAVVLPITNKYQKAVVDYIVQARAANLSDQTIHTNLFGAGWTTDDINFGFEAVGWKR